VIDALQKQAIFQLRTSDVDATGVMKVTVAADCFQEVAADHADSLGVGFDQMQAKNLFWALSYLKLTIYSYPQWRENIRITTWPSGFDRFYALRAFAIDDADGKKLVQGQSNWLVVDIATRRPCHVPQWILERLAVPHQPALTVPKEPFTGAEIERNFRVRYYDLDINQHVNNINYIEWILETVPNDILHEQKVQHLEINFRAEARLGDEILCSSFKDRNSSAVFYHRCVERSSNRELIRAQSQWQPLFRFS